MRKQNNNNELLSEDIREIISYQPGWIIRKGNTVFFIILFLLFLLTFVIKYPDVINAPARLTAINPPKPVNAKKEGRLLKLFVTNEQTVTKGDQLGYIESGANYNEIIKLQSWVEKTVTQIQSGKFNTILESPLPLLSNLGTLQSPYQEFQNQLEYTKQTLSNGYYNKKSSALHKDLQYISTLKKNAYQQQDLIAADQQLQQKELEAYEKLAKDKIIAPLELDKIKSKMIAKNQNVKQSDVALTNTDISTHGKIKEIIDLQKQVADQQQNFHSALLNLKRSIEEWVELYVLVASEDGKILFKASLQENELVSNNQTLFNILPVSSKYFVEVTVPQAGFGKIKAGQQVLLKVASYPSSEYGNLAGIIKHIDEIPNQNDSFLIKVTLPNGLKTNYGKNIYFIPGLTAQAEIITDNRKLFDRMAGKFVTIWK